MKGNEKLSKSYRMLGPSMAGVNTLTFGTVTKVHLPIKITVHVKNSPLHEHQVPD